ncbi:hypothetical protein KJ780_05300, partial [Candidatus Micrarchaeota archaeon]|nr:hypothetical protein [Candidatus Micrarchaeota archaeon]
LLNNAEYAEFSGKKLFKPEYFVNFPHILTRAKNEIANRNMNKALFFLRTASDLVMLSLNSAPFEGECLDLVRFFNERESMLGNMIKTAQGIENMMRRMGYAEGVESFGRLLVALSELRMKNSENAKICKNLFLHVDYRKDVPELDLVQEKNEVKRGSDFIKLCFEGSELTVYRAMVQKSCKGKEIKKHADELISIIESRSKDKKKHNETLGSFGWANYEIISKEGQIGVALKDSKRYY